MGWHNPPVRWSELERRLSDTAPGGPGDPASARTLGLGPQEGQKSTDGRPSNVPPVANGGDSPAWSAKRQAYEPPTGLTRRPSPVPYAELHCHSNFSFLDGASHPEELAEEAARLGLEALALTDHDGFYGVVRFAEAARAIGLTFPQSLRLVVMPQALRTVVGPLGGIFIALLKNSSLAVAINVPELTSAAEDVGTATASFIPAYLGAAAANLMLTIPSGFAVAWIERRTAIKR